MYGATAMLKGCVQVRSRQAAWHIHKCSSYLQTNLMEKMYSTARVSGERGRESREEKNQEQEREREREK